MKKKIKSTYIILMVALIIVVGALAIIYSGSTVISDAFLRKINIYSLWLCICRNLLKIKSF